MWIEDLTKALYFLNVTDYKDLVNITKIEKELIWFSNREMYPVQILVNCYDNYIKTGEIVKLW